MHEEYLFENSIIDLWLFILDDLTSIGEILTFAGTLLGIDANYRIHVHRIKHKDGTEELYTDQGDQQKKTEG